MSFFFFIINKNYCFLNSNALNSPSMQPTMLSVLYATRLFS